MTCAHIAASTGSKDVMKELTQFNKYAISAKNKVSINIYYNQLNCMTETLEEEESAVI